MLLKHMLKYKTNTFVILIYVSKEEQTQISSHPLPPLTFAVMCCIFQNGYKRGF
jgi:hypothetical protein